MDKFYLKINGINHDRYIGKYNNCYYDFDIINLQGYEAITEEETKQAEEKARNYYDVCVEKVRTGNFSILKISESEIKKEFNKHCKKMMKQAEKEGLFYFGGINKNV